MTFSQPLFVYITLILIPVIIGLMFMITWQRRQDLRLLGQSTMINKLMSTFSKGRRIVKACLLAMGLLLLAMALAGPQYGAKMVEVHRQGVDVVIALDVSKSMLAEDIKPNRLERAKQELSALIDQLHGDRIGIMAFAGNATIACPLTTDYAAAKMFLSYLRPEQVPLPGTSLSGAIKTALSMYTSGSEGYRVLVLLTDGEDHEKNVMDYAEQAKQAGVKILSIGFGSPKGEPIPIKNEQGLLLGYVKDHKGKTVVTKLDEVSLQKITSLTKGIYVPAHQGILEASNLADHIDHMQKQDISSGQYGANEDRYQFLLLPAILCLLAGFWLPIRKQAWLFILILFFHLSPLAMAGPAEDINKGNRAYKKGNYEESINKYRDAQIKRPEEEIIYYNLGNSLHQQDKQEEAEQAYQKVLKSKNKKLQSKTYYNLGNNYFKQEKYKEAVEAYKKTLKLNPKDQDALYNLAQTLLVMKNPEQKQQKKDKDKKQDKNKDKNQKQQQSSKQQDEADKKKDQDQKQANQSKDNKDKQKGPDDKGIEKSEDKPVSDPEEERGEPLPKPGEMSKEDAKNLLNSIREAEQQAQQERLKKQGQQIKNKGQRDW